MPSTAYWSAMRSMYASLGPSDRAMKSASDARAIDRIGSLLSRSEKIQLLQ
jgi:hypothetical protein